MNVQESEIDLNIDTEAFDTIKQNISVLSACGSLFCVKQAEKAPTFRNKELTVKVWGGRERERKGVDREIVQWVKCKSTDLSLNPQNPWEARCSSVHCHCWGCHERWRQRQNTSCQPASLEYGVHPWTEWRPCSKVEDENQYQKGYPLSFTHVPCSSLTNVQYICMCCMHTGKATECKVLVLMLSFLGQGFFFFF